MRGALLAAAACGVCLAGEIYTPSCRECGYEGPPVWSGCGPGGEWEPVMAVYFCPADRRYYGIELDPCGQFAAKEQGVLSWSDLEARTSFIEANAEVLSAFLYSWRPPSTLTDADASSWWRVHDAPAPGGRLFLEERPWEGAHVCPACGGRALEFVETGCWD